MNGLISTLLRLALNLLLLAMGLLVGLSLLCAAAVLGLVWGLRRLWARLTGRPVQAWVFRFQPRSSWLRYQQARQAWTAASARGQSPSADPAETETQNSATGQATSPLSTQTDWRERRAAQLDDVTDVKPK